jgi:hypothetical protein
MKTDAAETYDKLMKMQREEHWFVESRLEGDNNHLTGLFWMRPIMEKFHDVAINDYTSQTNKYRMYSTCPLQLLLIIMHDLRWLLRL